MAWLAGQKIVAGTWPDVIIEKHHPVSAVDIEAEAFITAGIVKKFPNALIVGEESSHNMKISFEKMVELGMTTYFVDPRDGTTEQSHQLPMWSVSIGVMKDGIHIGGAIAAPDWMGGFLMISEVGKGVFIWERGSMTPIKIPAFTETPKKLIVGLGLDVQRHASYHEVLKALPPALKPRGLAPSGALGMAMVAAGRWDAIIQSPQYPWDWAAGYATLEAQTEIMTYLYMVQDGKIISINFEPIGGCYNVHDQSLGFIAGRREVVEQLIPILEKYFGK
jgi:myo-inositol-1(or 4)-monophosphatase